MNKIFIGVAGIALLGSVAAFDFHQYQKTQDTFQATVVNKERICETIPEYDTIVDANGVSREVQVGSRQECTNYVHTDRETLINDGVIWAGYLDATAMQGRLVPGEQYTFKVYGSSNEAFGQYRKIIQVAKIIPGGGKMGGAGSSNW